MRARAARALAGLLALACGHERVGHTDPAPVVSSPPSSSAGPSARPPDVLDEGPIERVRLPSWPATVPLKARVKHAVADMAAHERARVRFIQCHPWEKDGYICDVCYATADHHYAQSRVWCDAIECELVVDNRDPRIMGTDWDLCDKR